MTIFSIFLRFLSIQAIFEKLSMTRVGREKFLMFFITKNWGQNLPIRQKGQNPACAIDNPPVFTYSVLTILGGKLMFMSHD